MNDILNEKPRITVDHKSNLPMMLGINERRILEIRAQAKGLVISDARSYESTKKLRTEVVTMRTTLEKKRKEVSKPYQDKVKEIKDEADRLKALIQDIETPLQETVRNWEEKKEQEHKQKQAAEAARLANIRQEINKFNAGLLWCMGKSSAAIKEAIDTMPDVTQAVFQESFQEAVYTREVALKKMQDLYEDTVCREEESARIAAERQKMAEERAEMERQRKEQEEKIAFEREAQATIATFRNFPSLLIGKTLTQLHSLNDSLVRKAPREELLQQFYADAMDAYHGALQSLEQAVKAEKERVAQQEELEALRREKREKEEREKAEAQALAPVQSKGEYIQQEPSPMVIVKREAVIDEHIFEHEPRKLVTRGEENAIYTSVIGAELEAELEAEKEEPFDVYLDFDSLCIELSYNGLIEKRYSLQTFSLKTKHNAELLTMIADIARQSHALGKQSEQDSKEYNQILKDSRFLECLRSFGVDNWARYEDAKYMWYAEYPEYS